MQTIYLCIHLSIQSDCKSCCQQCSFCNGCYTFQTLGYSIMTAVQEDNRGGRVRPEWWGVVLRTRNWKNMALSRLIKRWWWKLHLRWSWNNEMPCFIKVDLSGYFFSATRFLTTSLRDWEIFLRFPLDSHWSAQSSSTRVLSRQLIIKWTWKTFFLLHPRPL